MDMSPRTCPPEQVRRGASGRGPGAGRGGAVGRVDRDLVPLLAGGVEREGGDRRADLAGGVEVERAGDAGDVDGLAGCEGADRDGDELTRRRGEVDRDTCLIGQLLDA